MTCINKLVVLGIKSNETMKKYELVKEVQLTSGGYQTFYSVNCDGKYIAGSTRMDFDEALKVFEILSQNDGEFPVSKEVILTVEK